MRRLIAAGSVAAGVLLLAAGSAGAAGPSLKDVLRRMTDYIAGYGQQASVIVATERYAQTFETNAGRQQRQLRSEFAIVRTANGWVGFRDVLDVDGTPVADHQGRLEKLLGDGSDLTAARRVAEESARFNLGVVERNFNVPTTALFFFTADNIGRFRFAIAARAPDRWRLTFRETARQTMIHQPDGRPVPVRGEIDVNPDTGAVTRTVMHMEGFDPSNHPDWSTASIEVAYRLVSGMGTWLPATMKEMYFGAANSAWHRVTGEAVYTEYRRFETSVRIK